jgi:ABC-type oligopeptide transport system substrate-binding subunit
LINKEEFITTELAGMGQAAHSPLWHNPTYRYEPCAEFSSEIYDPPAAYQMLYDSGYRDWDNDGIIEYSSDGGITKNEFTIVVYARSDDTHRTALGNLVNTVLTTGAEGSVLGAKFDVDLNIVPRATCYQKVMIEYNYTLYTGGWSFGRDPDTIYFIYHSRFATKPEPWANNYVNYRSAEFDEAIENMIGASTFEEARYWCNESQRILMSDVAVIPMWNTAGYTGILSTVEKAVHMSAYGPTTSTGAWWTLLNAHVAGQPFGGTLRWGFMNDFSALSVYMSQWVWDWNILQEIYDTLISYNPYNYTMDLPELARSWEVGNWTFGGETCTYVTWHLRHDLYWEDIPPKPDRLYGIAPYGTGALHIKPDGTPDPQPPIPVTAEDVAFSVEYIAESWDAWNWGLVADVVYCDIEDPYTVTVYYGIYMPLWAAHWCGSLPIMPKFIWSKVPIEQAGKYDPLAQKTLCGTGPFQFNYTAYVPHQYVVLDKYERFFALNPVDVYVKADGVRVDPGSSVNYTIQLANRDAENTITGDLSIKVDGITVGTVTGLTLEPKATYETTLYNTGALALGKHNITATFDVTSPSVFATMDSTYTHGIWSTIIQDLNYDFKVNILDLITIGVAFGSKPGDVNWDARADIVKDYKINILDMIKVATFFGWPSS